jgi:hypothetical protein
MIFFMPGEFIALLTFPGVIVHEFAHRFFCDLQGVPVYHVQYFIPGSKTAGQVLHAHTTARHALWIAYAPLIINSALCMILTFPCAAKIMLGTECAAVPSGLASMLYKVSVWLGFSIGFNSVPSKHDVQDVKLESSNIFYIFLFNCVSLLTVASNVNYIGFWVRFGYTIILAALLPSLLLF